MLGSFVPGGNNAIQTRDWISSTGPKSVRVTVSQAVCLDEDALYTFNVVADPIAPTIAKLPADLTVCPGTTLTVTITTLGSGGTGTCVDEYRFSTDGTMDTEPWSTTIPSFAAVTGTNIVESRRNCDAAGCASNVNSVSWTVGDGVAPMALCQNITIELNENGLATISLDDIDNGSDDNCAFTLSLSQTDFTCDEVTVPGPEVLAYGGAITDGNQAFTELLGMIFSVNTPVEITALGAFDDDQDGLLLPIQVGIVRNDGMVMAGPITLSGSGDPLDAGHRVQPIAPVLLAPGQYTIVALGYGATEQNGNSNLSGPGSITNTGGGLLTFNSASYGGGVFGSPATPFAVSNVFHAGTFKFRQAEVGTTVTLTVTDNSGNTATCTATVTVEDNLPPEVLCFPELIVQLDQNGEATITAEDLVDNATDNCEIDTYLVDSFFDISFDCDNVGKIS